MGGQLVILAAALLAARVRWAGLEAWAGGLGAAVAVRGRFLRLVGEGPAALDQSTKLLRNSNRGNLN